MADFLQSPPTPPIVNVLPPSALMLGLGGKSSGVLLKKKTERVPFVNYDISLDLTNGNKAVADRLRQLDAYHLHSPTDVECTRLNLPNSRLNLLQLKDVLYLCGGLVGARFSTEDLTELREITHGMSDLWNDIENLFKSLDNVGKKLVLSTEALAAPCDEADSSPTGIVRRFHHLADKYLAQCSTLQQVVRRIQSTIDTTEQHGNRMCDCI